MIHHGEVTQLQREPHLMIILIHFAKMVSLQLTSMKTGATHFKIMKTIILILAIFFISQNNFARIQISNILDFTSNIVHPYRSY